MRPKRDTQVRSVGMDRCEDFTSGPTGLLAFQVTSESAFAELVLRKTEAHRRLAEAIENGDEVDWQGNRKADKEADLAVADQLPGKEEIALNLARRKAAF